MAIVKEILLKKLILDLENYRTTKRQNEPEALNSIIAADETDFLNLVNDIAQNGLSLSNNVVVIQPDDSKQNYVVREGNRRIACLKLLFKLLEVPVGNTKVSKQISRLVGEQKKEWIKAHEKINCLLCTPEEADREVKLRHGKGLKGIDLTSWGSMANARYDKYENHKSHPELDIVESYISSTTDFNASEREIYLVQYPLTTVERIIKQLAIHLKTTATNLAQNYPTHVNKKEIDSLLYDIGIGTIKVTHVDNIVLTQGILDRYIPLEKKVSSGNESQQQDDSDKDKAGGTPKDNTPPSKVPSRGGTAATSNIHTFSKAFPSLRITDPNQNKTQELIKEIKKLHTNKNPNAFCMLFRSILELSIMGYCQRNGIATKKSITTNTGNKLEDIKLLQLCQLAKEHIEKNSSKHGIKKLLQEGLSVLGNDKYAISINNLHNVVHGTQYTATSSQNSIGAELTHLRCFLVELHK